MEHLQHLLKAFAGIDEAHFEMSADMWQPKSYSKGDFFNEYRNVCKYLGIIESGVFRTYYIDDKNAEEKNVFFFTPNQVVVAYKSFVTQTPCNYYTQAVNDAHIHYIHIESLQKLYNASHQWEKLGRLIAEMAFTTTMDRMESFIFKSPEERYLEMIETHPDIFNSVPLYHIASYLGIQGPSLSRIRKRMLAK